MGNRYLDDLSKANWGKLFDVLANFLWIFAKRLWWGLRSGNLPLDRCLWATTVLSVIITFRLDSFLFSRINCSYPGKHWLFYSLFMTSSPFWGWAIAKAAQDSWKIWKVNEIFDSKGFITAAGRKPKLLSDDPIDEYCRRFRFSRAIYSVGDFKSIQTNLESSFGIHVDRIEENRGKKTIDVIYSYDQIIEYFELTDIESISPLTFCAGKSRSAPVFCSLLKVPHYLVAGRSNGGKTTFLKQVAATLYLKNPLMEFTMIDLKEGTDFKIFEQLPRMHVEKNVERATTALCALDGKLDIRLQTLRDNNFTSLSDKGAEKVLNRQIIMIDEAAELFLKGSKNSSGEVQRARAAVSRIARLGRSAGVHLFIATQRPDVNAIDSQVKANLQGILAFQMPNHASSMTILGNGRAAELPEIIGRAFWKVGRDTTEVQSPYISTDRLEEILKPYRVKEGAQDVEKDFTALEKERHSATGTKAIELESETKDVL